MNKFFKTFLLAFTTILLATPINAQKYASTVPSNKNAVLELFTGVRSAYCAKGDAVANSVINKYPGKVYLISYHPSNGSLNTPYGSDEDLQREWPSTFYTPAFAGLIDMPVCFINRRLVNSIRALKKDVWTSKTFEITKEPSPCNIGFWGTYDATSKQLSIDLEVYFTSAVTDNYNIYAVLVQDSVIAMQATADEYEANYAHHKVFREALTDVWGEPITEPLDEGALITRKYTFDNSTANYKIEKCSVVVFIRNVANEEIITGMGGKAHSDRITVSSLHKYSAIGAGETKEQVFTIRNISEQTGTLELSVSKSKRTPTDWNVDFISPGKIIKKTDNPQAASMNLDAGDSVNITVNIKSGDVVGAGDAILKIVATNLYNETKFLQFTTLSNSFERLEILERPTDIEPYSLNQIVKSTGRPEFFKFESKGFGDVYADLPKLEVVSWSFNPCDTLKEEYATTMYNVLKKGISVLITGTYSLGSLYDIYAGHPLFNYLGVTIDEANAHKYEESTFTFVSESEDENFPNLLLPWKLNAKTDSLLQPLQIKKANIASSVLKVWENNMIVATKSQTADSRAILLHFNPYSLTVAANRQKLIDQCFDWLEAPFADPPNVAFNVAELDFGDVISGKYLNLDLEITNSGESTLELKKFELSGTDKDNFNLYSGGISGTRSMAPGVKHTVTLRFTAPPNLQTAKDYVASFDVSTNVNTDSVFKLVLKARGVSSNGVEEKETNLLNVKVTPNPTGNQAIVSFELNGINETFVNASLIDAKGSKVQSIFNDFMQPGTFKHVLNTTGLASGSYFLVVKSACGYYNIKVVINK
jgi:hypothetical protein